MKSGKHFSFNHGVEGSSPSALTNEIRHNLNFSFPAWPLWEAHGKQGAKSAEDAMTQVKVSGVRPTAEDDGSHVVELADGSVAVIPADQVPALVQALQWGLARRVFAQSQQFANPTESTLALPELHLMDAQVAAVGRSTNLVCNLSECGWVSFLSEDAVLRQMKDKIDQVLLQRSAPSNFN
jgi:hypothetical protein